MLFSENNNLCLESEVMHIHTLSQLKLHNQVNWLCVQNFYHENNDNLELKQRPVVPMPAHTGYAFVSSRTWVFQSSFNNIEINILSQSCTNNVLMSHINTQDLPAGLQMHFVCVCVVCVWSLSGSHDSMSYDLDTQSSIVEPDALKVFSNIYYVRKVLYNWAVTQEEPITKQLDAGVRYFDLRIARKPDDTDPTRLYFYHGLYTHTDVETILTAINGWAESHPKEILILALSHFKGFDKDGEQLHSHLINFIKTLFGAKLLQRFDIPTLKSSWDKGRNVIVSYDYPANQHPEIWCKIPYFYGNSMDPAQVESKICCVLEKPRPCGFFVCGLNLTLPEDAGALRYVLCSRGNFANVTERSLPEMVQWVKQYAGRRPNIVASDVVTRDDFVSTIVQLNYKGN
ncbi:PI-PLC X domain-containing protein 1-like [Solea senegalensis]|uniref:PI-PLC X domain-containing protein 1-like n=1 Tax=Solea senegalensis TaxID=28829 RepID=A0AAV6RT51_SOLSE|nr:PI-PLC X domain-containing protein 1-like [Solea senegalensis]